MVTLNETNVNDNDTVIAADTASFDYAEGTAAGVTLGSVSATDADGSAITYSIAPGHNVFDTNNNALYQVNSAGEISLTTAGAAAFTNDVESGDNQHEITVTATGTDGSGADTVDTIVVTLNETNVNDSAPIAVDDGTVTSTTAVLGLAGEYFGIDATDAVGEGGQNNLIDSLADFKALIAGKEPDATFTGTSIFYGDTTHSDSVSVDENLVGFLGDDASSIVWNDNDTTSREDHPEGGIHLTGSVYLEAGTYTFTVLADDGYEITIDGDIVATAVLNQSPTSNSATYTIDEDGYHSIDMIWWDQGGKYVFQPAFSKDGGPEYFLDASILVQESDVSSLYGTTQDTDVTILASQILANDTDEDDSNDALSVNSVGGATNGSVSLDDAGNVVFKPDSGYVGEASFEYTITDSAGNISNTATVTLYVHGNPIAVNVEPTAPTISEAETSTVSEEGLTGAIAETDIDGNPDDTTNEVVSTGQFSVEDVNGDTLSVTLNTPAGTYTSGGNDITWTLSNSDHTLTGSTVNGDVLKVEINDDGSYTTTLQGPIDHTDTTSEDTLAIDIGVTVSDGSLSSQSTLSVVIEDDSVKVEDATNNIHFQAVNTNVQLVLDFSGSMNYSVDDGTGTGTNTTALAIMKQAVSDMLSEYQSLGNVKVNIVTFSGAADTHADGWMSVSEAISYVTALTSSDMGGRTNYDAALLETMDSFGAGGSIVNAQNVSYFLTDGAPSGSSGIQSGEEATWVNFLNANNINSFSFAMGSGASQTNINPIAYDASVSPSSNTQGVVVANISELPPILRDTVNGENLGQLTQGSVGDAVGFGADGNGYLASISIDGTTYAYNAEQNTISVTGKDNASFDTASHILMVETALNGKFAINMLDGTYEYTASGTQTIANEAIGYTAVDGDGDSDSAVLTIDIVPAGAAPEPVYSTDADVTKTYQYTPSGGISTGSGDDTITVSVDIQSNVSTGSGNDTVFIGDDIINSAVINMGAGDDVLNFERKVAWLQTNYAGTVDMGSGADTIVFAKGNSAEFTYSIDNSGMLHIEHKTNSAISLYVENVEHIYFGGDDKTYDVGTGAVQQGVFIDGIVSGLAYQTSSGLTGLTGENGGFNYLAGDTVTFTIGGIVLGSMDTDNLQNEQLFLQDLANVARTDVNDEYVENMAVLLQSLDVDGDAYNGIVITQAMRDAFSDNDFDLATISEQDLVTIIEETGHTAINEDAAMEHVQDMLELHAGMDGAEFDQRVLDDSVGSDIGNDTIIVGSDNAYLIGDTGGDLGSGIDTSEWYDGDQSSEIMPATDHITDFNILEDKLDLSDLLDGVKTDDLGDYLELSFGSDTTTISIHAKGDVSAVSQVIILDNVDLSTAYPNVDFTSTAGINSILNDADDLLGS